MHHKRRSLAPMLFILLIAVTAITAVLLMFKDVKAPTHTIEKELDAQTFLPPKQ